MALKGAQDLFKEEQDRYKELEKERNELELNLQEAQNWKSIYEDEHGLADAVKLQKRLKADIKVRQQEEEE